MATWLQIIITVISTLIASSGFWAFIMKKMEKKDALTNLVLALAQDRIVFLCDKYIERGSIKDDEFDVLEDIYLPYTDNGGNHKAKQRWERVQKLPIKN